MEHFFTENLKVSPQSTQIRMLDESFIQVFHDYVLCPSSTPFMKNFVSQQHLLSTFSKCLHGFLMIRLKRERERRNEQLREICTFNADAWYLGTLYLEDHICAQYSLVDEFVLYPIGKTVNEFVSGICLECTSGEGLHTFTCIYMVYSYI